jgi:predicted ATP-grasp superfamily ATP-dependent carboligase
VVSLYTLDDIAAGSAAPAMVAAFDGWVDAAGAASDVADRLARSGERVATFDADVLFDYRSRRPVLDVVDGSLTRLVWPEFALHRRTFADRDVLVLHGAEPDFRWKELGDDVVELCQRLGVVEWVSLGAVPAAVPHTRPVPVLATASDEARLHEAETQGPRGLLRVPSAALSAIELAVSGSGIPAVGFFAQVPHYVGGPYAAASLSLLRHLSRHLKTDLPTGDLEDEAVAQRERLDAAVEADEDVREILHRLEGMSDEGIPSGDDIAAEIERFLRSEDGGGTLPPG